MPALRATRSRRGLAFTLVELMVSIAILSMLVVMLAGIFGQVSNAWLSSEGDIERRRNNRALTDFIATELRSAVVPVEQAATPNRSSNLQFLINPPADLVPPEKYANADTIFWQAPVATETSFGELAELGYFVRWSETAAPRPALCRFFVNPSTSGPGGTVVQNSLSFLIYKNPRWVSAALLDEIAPATAPGYQGLFAENVVGFWVRAYQPDGKELLASGERRFDSRTGYKFTNAQKAVEDRFLPSKVQISLAQLDSRTIDAVDASGPQLRQLVKAQGVRDAADFLQAVQTAATRSPAIARLLPGLRIYSTEVKLENAR